MPIKEKKPRSEKQQINDLKTSIRMKLYHEKAKQVQLIDSVIESIIIGIDSEHELITQITEYEELFTEKKDDLLEPIIISKAKRGRPKKSNPFSESELLSVFQKYEKPTCDLNISEPKLFPAWRDSKLLNFP